MRHEVVYPALFERKVKQFDTKNEAQQWAMGMGIYKYCIIKPTTVDIDEDKRIIETYFDPYQFEVGCEFDGKV
jgi:hypothetical protein